MSEFSDFIKAIIDKVGFKTFLFSSVIAILSYKLWLYDWIWATAVFGVSYLITYGISQLYKSIVQYIKKANEEKKYKGIRYDNFCHIFNSLNSKAQHQLIDLYRLPQQKNSTVRILRDNIPGHDEILKGCQNIRYIYHDYYMMDIERGFGSHIITIDDVLCEVLAEMNKKSNHK
ncbi:MAG: hypothetical protein IJ352_09310 [Muribaculaceae bacterium]|nr:hypothetical protein [Muribaculaceae bacterium]